MRFRISLDTGGSAAPATSSYGRLRDLIGEAQSIHRAAVDEMCFGPIRRGKQAGDERLWLDVGDTKFHAQPTVGWGSLWQARALAVDEQSDYTMTPWSILDVSAWPESVE